MRGYEIEHYASPAMCQVDFELLKEFENGLNIASPKHSYIPCKVLGYGEISTVLQIQDDSMRNLAFKRMSIFDSTEELRKYLELYLEYTRMLEYDLGVCLLPHGHAAFKNASGRQIFYIIQLEVPPASIANKAIHYLSPAETKLLIRAILRELHKVWEFNLDNQERQIAIDGQISNWSIANFDEDNPRLEEKFTLHYFDTSTPFLRIQGVEQLNPELFLRAAPSFLVWILRLLFLEDVMTRYYDARKVTIDLLANLYKEQRSDLIPDMVAAINDFFSGEAAHLGVKPLQQSEISSYYREDRIIWSWYLSMRKFDRFLQRIILRREYPYILPEKIKR